MTTKKLVLALAAAGLLGAAGYGLYSIGNRLGSSKDGI